jgi:membrane protease YdiL (CAAX protease family)
MYLSRYALLKLAILTEGAAFFIAIVLGLFFRTSLFPITADFTRDVFLGTAFALPPLFFFFASFSKRAKTWPIIRSLRKTMSTDIKAIFSESNLIDLIIISVCAGIGEEFLFRGVIQAQFGIIIASVVFGLAHFVTPAYVIVATIMGFYMGLLFSVSGSLLIPMQTHFIYDLGALIYLRYFVRNEEVVKEVNESD